jgi:hypothetical protein
MDCEIKYKGKDYTYEQFATLLHEGELEILAPKMDSRYFVISEGYNPFEGKEQIENVRVSALKDTESTAKALDKIANENPDGHAKLEGQFGVMYHGTEADFDKFDRVGDKIPSLGLGYYFTPTLEKAKQYGSKIKKIVLEGAKILNWNKLSDTERSQIKNRLEERMPSSLINGLGETKTKTFNLDTQRQESLDFYNKKREETQGYEYDRGKARVSRPDKDNNITISWKENGLDVNDTELLGFAQQYDNNIGNEMGYDAVKYGNEIAVFNGDKIKNVTNEVISEAYHKAKKDGTNPELVRSVEDLINGNPLEQARKNLSKAWNKLGNQGIVYDPIQNERDFIDFVKALFDFVKVYGRDKAIPEIVKYAKSKLGIGDKGSMKPKVANSIEQYAQSLLDKYNELTPSEIDAVLGAFANNVSKESFNKNVDTMVRFAKMKESKANQFKELYGEASQIKTEREEEKVKTMGDKPKFASPLQILLLDVGDNPNGELLQRITAITTDRNQERSNEDLQKDATYVEESLERLRNIAFDDASMLFNFYNSSPDWVSKFLTELEDNVKKGKSGEGYMIPPARLVGILNVMNNDTYERILKATDPIEREELLKLRDRLDSFTNDTMRGYSLAFNARRSDLILAEFARGGVLNDYATSRILTKKQTEQVSRIQDAIKNKASQKQLNNVNIPSANPITPTTSKSKPKASNKKKVDAKFEAEMIEESKKAKSTSREERAKDLRDRLFNAINKCK